MAAFDNRQLNLVARLAGQQQLLRYADWQQSSRGTVSIAVPELRRWAPGELRHHRSTADLLLNRAIGCQVRRPIDTHHTFQHQWRIRMKQAGLAYIASGSYPKC